MTRQDEASWRIAIVNKAKLRTSGLVDGLAPVCSSILQHQSVPE